MVLWETDGVSVNRISQKLLLNTNTLSPLLKRMEKMELIKRNRSIEDKRSVIVQLTKKGKQLRVNALPIPEKLIMELISKNIKMEDMLKLKDILDGLILALGHKSES
jgi:DNA-binding MarR family transcriptional regulator